MDKQEPGVFFLAPSGTLSATTEAIAVDLIKSHAGYSRYIFFFAELYPVDA
jgi:hypothetical protein